MTAAAAAVCCNCGKPSALLICEACEPPGVEQSTSPPLDNVVELRNGATSIGAEGPRSSFLVPSSTGTKVVEVEWLLKEHAEGRISPEKVHLLPLPENATQPMREVAEFYARVRGLRLWAGDDRDVPFGCAWVGENLRLPKVTVWRSIQKLVDAGVLIHTGHLPGQRDMRGTYTYLEGRRTT